MQNYEEIINFASKRETKALFMTTDHYILQHIDSEPGYLRRLYRATQVHLLRGRMASGHLQGRLLKMLVQLSGARSILEIGTFSGYATLCLSEGLPEGGCVHTFEINDEQEDFTRPWLEGRYDHCGYPEEVFQRICLHIGDALELVPRMGLSYDLAFIDGDKRHYIDYYEMVMKHLNPGGLIIADNTLWDGHVLEESPHERMTLGIQHFNDHVAQDKRVCRVLLPMRDGLTLIRLSD